MIIDSTDRRGQPNLILLHKPIATQLLSQKTERRAMKYATNLLGHFHQRVSVTKATALETGSSFKSIIHLSGMRAAGHAWWQAYRTVACGLGRTGTEPF